MMIKDIVDDLPQHPHRTYGSRFFKKIKYIALHHTGGKGSIEAFANYHVSKGWPGIGYHFVIDKKGDVYQTNRLDTVSYNVGGHNTKVVGIAVIGDYRDKKLSENQKDAITDLVLLIRTLIGYRPVKGHSEFKATECPGKHITNFIKTLNP